VAHATCAQQDGAIALGPSTVELLVRAGSYVDPTLMVARDGVAQRRAEQRTAMIPLLRTMHDAGVPLTAGTDAGVPGVAHGSVSDAVVNQHEDVGLDLPAALLAATAIPARAYGIDGEVGAIAAGLAADLLLVDGRVDQDIRAVTRPVAVWRDGNLAMRDGLVRYR
jgi:imidazolonepropionase-like amidohydrolase